MSGTELFALKKSMEIEGNGVATLLQSAEKSAEQAQMAGQNVSGAGVTGVGQKVDVKA